MLPNFFDISAPVPIIHQCPNCDRSHEAEPPNGLLVVCECGEMIEIYRQGIFWAGHQACPRWANGGTRFDIAPRALERIEGILRDERNTE